MVYCNHIEKLVVDIHNRFKDTLKLDVPASVLDPFMDVQDVDDKFQSELIGLQNDEELKVKFQKSYTDFWLQQQLHQQYPLLWDKVQVLFVAFPTSYLMELGFSVVSVLLTKQMKKAEH